MNTETIRRVSETIADTLIIAEQEIRTEAQAGEWHWWLNFLRKNGQLRLWRKALLTKYILVESADAGEDRR